MLCSEAVLVNLGLDEGRCVTLKCRSWSCEICQPDRKRQLMALAFRGKPNTFITLTVNPGYLHSPEARARALVDAWRNVARRAKRKYGYKTIPYLAVFEATKKGEPHLHILCRVKWIDQAWLSEQMRQEIDAPIVDIRRVRERSKLANYVAKYVGKDPHRFEGTKRYWRTLDWMVEQWEKEEQPGTWSNVWEIRSHDISYQEECWQILGWRTWRCRGMLYGTGNDPPF